MFVWLEAVKQYVFHVYFDFPANTMVQIRHWASITLYRFTPVVSWSAIQYNNSTFLVSASIMDLYCTGWCRFHSNIWYPHMTVTSVFMSLVRFIEHVIHTHDRYMICIEANDKLITLLKPDCTVAEKGRHKNDHIVYCVRNNAHVNKTSPETCKWH